MGRSIRVHELAVGDFGQRTTIDICVKRKYDSDFKYFSIHQLQLTYKYTTELNQTKNLIGDIFSSILHSSSDLFHNSNESLCEL